jgi:mono/diheme cytochrome c family protein
MGRSSDRLSRFRLFWLLLIVLWLVAACAAPPESTPQPTLEPTLAFGRTVFERNCAACHATTPDRVVRGPSLYGIATHGNERREGMDARTYIYDAIVNPRSFMVPGYDNSMPTTFGKSMTGEQLDALVDYLMTLK